MIQFKSVINQVQSYAPIYLNFVTDVTIWADVLQNSFASIYNQNKLRLKAVQQQHILKEMGYSCYFCHFKNQLILLN
jgi:hypothetical protein